MKRFYYIPEIDDGQHGPDSPRVCAIMEMMADEGQDLTESCDKVFAALWDNEILKLCTELCEDCPGPAGECAFAFLGSVEELVDYP